MAQFLKVLKADPLGAPWTPKADDAKPIQNYWCQVEGQDKPVSIGRQVDNPLYAGENVYGDLMYAKSQKGTEYWRFKSVKVPDDVQRPANSPVASPAPTPSANMSAAMPDWFKPVANQIDYIFREMKKMDSTLPQEVEAPEPQTIEPVDAETQAKLDELFAPEPEV